MGFRPLCRGTPHSPPGGVSEKIHLMKLSPTHECCLNAKNQGGSPFKFGLGIVHNPSVLLIGVPFRESSVFTKVVSLTEYFFR